MSVVRLQCLSRRNASVLILNSRSILLNNGLKVNANLRAFSAAKNDLSPVEELEQIKANILKLPAIPTYKQIPIREVCSTNSDNATEFVDIKLLGNENMSQMSPYKHNDLVSIRGRVDTSRITKNSCFLIMRCNSLYTIQCVCFDGIRSIKTKYTQLTDKYKELDTNSNSEIRDCISGIDSLIRNYDEEYRLFNEFSKNIPRESIVEITGRVIQQQVDNEVDVLVKSCSQKHCEIEMLACNVVCAPTVHMPISVHDTYMQLKNKIVGDCIGTTGIDTSGDMNNVSDVVTTKESGIASQSVRFDNRWLDLRVPVNNAVLRIQSAICHLFREYLMFEEPKKHDQSDSYNSSFVEIHTPKLIAGASEGGADVFKLKYFDRTACLAQSPQLYKQMAIASDFKRVFEIGPVFRAENSHTKRHLCEFVGLDIEMEIQKHYSEALEVIHGMLHYVFHELETNPKYSREMEVIREAFPREPLEIPEKPVVIHWQDALAMLRERYPGIEMGDFDDLTSAIELQLGALVKEKFHTDLFILDQYPSNIRPFYTMRNPEDTRYSNSYDIFLCGQEISSGAQRCHDPKQLQAQIEERGLDVSDFQSYVNCFEHGVSPHAGSGIGLERIVYLYLGLDNVRRTSMFPRTPQRLTP